MEEFQVTFKGFRTAKQAQVFAEWYSGSGEQESAVWLEEHSDIDSAYARGMKSDENGNVIVTLEVGSIDD